MAMSSSEKRRVSRLLGRHPWTRRLGKWEGRKHDLATHAFMASVRGE
jgi:hypothetical protein